MSRDSDFAAASRHRATELFGSTRAKDVKRPATGDKQRLEEEAKMARLRALRLAKEATDLADQKAAKEAPPSRRKSPG
jgi:hypothetical protein